MEGWLFCLNVLFVVTSFLIFFFLEGEGGGGENPPRKLTKSEHQHSPHLRGKAHPALFYTRLESRRVESSRAAPHGEPGPRYEAHGLEPRAHLAREPGKSGVGWGTDWRGVQQKTGEGMKDWWGSNPTEVKDERRPFKPNGLQGMKAGLVKTC